MLRIGIVGTGTMAHRHAEPLSKIEGVELVACCDVAKDRSEAFAQKWQIPRTYSDYRQMLDNEKLDGICNVTSNLAHGPISLSALARKIHVLCEKPLATTLDEAREMTDAAQKSGMIHMVNFTYRDSSGLQEAAKRIRSGDIGRILHVESSYLQSWLVSTMWGDWRTSPTLGWQLSTSLGSTGVLGDIGCHIYDMTCLLCGDIDEIYCTVKTFDKGIPDNRLSGHLLDASDSFISNISFENGAIGTIHSSRWATGHANSLRVRVYGDRGGVEVDLDHSRDSYKICHGSECIDSGSWNSVACEPTPNAHERFIEAIRTGRQDPSDFVNGLKIQAYLHYSLESSLKGMAMKVRL